MNLFDLAAKITLDTKSYEKSVKDSQKSAGNLGKALSDVAKKSEELQKKANSSKQKIAELSNKMDESAKTTDKNSNETKKLGKELSDAEKGLRLTSDELKKYKAETDKSAKSTKSFGEKVKSAFKGIAIAAGAITAAVGAGATAAVKLAKDSAEAYANFEQNVGGIGTLFGRNAVTVAQNAQNAYKTVGISANEYMETAIGFSGALLKSLGGDTANAAKMTQTAISDMADQANKYGRSLEDVSATYTALARGNTQTLDNLFGGMFAGTKEGLREMLQYATDYRRSLGEEREYSVESYADIVSAIHDVSEALGVYGTTELEAEKTITGSLNATKAAWQNLLVSMASGKGIEESVSNLVSSAKTLAGNLVPVFTQALKGIGSAIGEIAPVIIQELPHILEEVVPALFDAAVSIVGALFDFLMETIKTTDWVQLGHDIIEFIKNIDWVGLIQGLSSMVGGIVGAIFGLLVGIFETVITDIGNWLYDNFGDPAELTWEGFIKSLGEVFSNIGVWVMQNIVEPLIKGFCDALGFDGEEAVRAMYEWVGDLGEAITEFIDDAKETFGNIVDAVKKPFTDAWDFMVGIVDNIKSLFDFKWELPKLKLPHFSIGAGPTVLGIQLPKINIDWYKKAYEQPYLFDRPTVIGNKGFGDGNGAEMVYGRDNLMRDIREAVGESGITVNVYADQGMSVDELVDKFERALARMQRQRKAALA